MKISLQIILTFLLVILNFYFSHCQITKVDSIYFYSSIDTIINVRSSDPEKADKLTLHLLNFTAEKKYYFENAYAYYLFGTSKFYKGDYDLSLKITRKALNVFKKYDKKLYISMAYLQLGINDISQMKLDSAQLYLEKSKKIKEEIKDNEGLGYVYNSLGIIQDYSSNYPEAAELYIKALDIFNKTDNKGEASNTYNNLSIIQYNLGNFQDAIKSQHKAIELNKEIRQYSYLPMNYVCLSTYYSEVDSIEKAIQFGHDALEQSRKLENRRAILYSLSCLGDLYLKQNRYRESKNYYDEFIAKIDESVDLF